MWGCSSPPAADSLEDGSNAARLHQLLVRLERQIEVVSSGQRRIEEVVDSIHDIVKVQPAPIDEEAHNIVKDSSAADESGYATPPSQLGGVSKTSSHRDYLHYDGGMVTRTDRLTTSSHDYLHCDDGMVSAAGSDPWEPAAPSGGAPLIRPRREYLTIDGRRFSRSLTGSTPLLSIPTDSSSLESNMCYLVAACNLPMHPWSIRRTFVDVVSMALLLYDSIMVPYALAWGVDTTGWVAVVSVLMACFWTVDLMLGFATGFYHKDRLMMNFRAIAKYYIQTTFFPNLLVVGSDWTALIAEFATGGENPESASLIRTVRLLKLNRFLRLASSMRTSKTAQLNDRVVDLMRQWGMAEHAQFAASICKLLFLILWINHLGCCLWQVSMKLASETWYNDNLVQPEHVLNYLLGFYWSMSSIVAGESIMVPTTCVELVCTIFVILFGLLFGSILISSFAATLMKFQLTNREQQAKLKLLRQFLYQHHVTPTLAMPIVNEVMARMAQVKRLTEKDVDMLKALPPIMRAELRYYVYGQDMLKHGFFQAAAAVDNMFMRELCHRAFSHREHNPGDVVFQPGDESLGTYVVHWGSFDYQLMTEQSVLAGGPVSRLKRKASKGQWISEVALWSRWFHRGMCEATMPCELLFISAEGFIKVLQAHSDVGILARDYSTALCKAMYRQPPENLTDLTMTEEVDHMGIVNTMRLESRVLMSKAALDFLERDRQWMPFPRRKSLNELTDEVNRGKCDLVLEDREGVLRVVSVAAVRLARPDGRILAQIGKCTHGANGTQLTPECTLPGTKVKAGELPVDAVERILRGHLAYYKSGVTRGATELYEERKVSKAYGVITKYLRTVFNLSLERAEDYRLDPLARSSDEKIWTAKESKHHKAMDAYRGTLHCEAFMLPTADEGTIICSWVSEELYEMLKGDGGDIAVQQWVTELPVSHSL